MITAGTLCDMETMESTRDVVGAIVRAEIKRQGWNYNAVPEKLGMSLSTLNLIMRGKKVGTMQYRKVERVLELPRFLLDRVLEGDAKAVRSADLEPDLRRLILSWLSTTPDQRRRATDK